MTIEIEKIVSALMVAIEELVEEASKRQLTALLGGLAGAAIVAKRRPRPKPAARTSPKPHRKPRAKTVKRRRGYTDEYKAKIAAEAVAGPRGTIAKISRREDVPGTVISAWVKARRARAHGG